MTTPTPPAAASETVEPSYLADILEAPTFELNICAGVMLRAEAIKTVRLAGAAIRQLESALSAANAARKKAEENAHAFEEMAENERKWRDQAEARARESEGAIRFTLEHVFDTPKGWYPDDVFPDDPRSVEEQIDDGRDVGPAHVSKSRQMLRAALNRKEAT